MKPNNKTENGSPFKIPEGYFETLSDRVILAVHDNEEESENLLEKKNSFTRLRPYLAYAAIITGLVIISVGVIKLTSKSGEDFISDNKGSSVFMTEVMSEEIDIYSIEAEVIKSDDQHSSISITYDDNMDNLIIENLEETDIYDLL